MLPDVVPDVLDVRMMLPGACRVLLGDLLGLLHGGNGGHASTLQADQTVNGGVVSLVHPPNTSTLPPPSRGRFEHTLHARRRGRPAVEEE
jgi:hypothetical protein